MRHAFFTIVEASDSYLSAMEKKREEVIGRKLFDVFPEKLENIPDTGSGKLRGSLRRVMRTDEARHVGVTKKFHVPKQQGSLERYVESREPSPTASSMRIWSSRLFSIAWMTC